MQAFIWKPDDTGHLPRNTLRVIVTPLWHLWCLYRAMCAATRQKKKKKHSSVAAGWIWQRALKSRGKEKKKLFTKQVLVSKGFSVSKQRLVGLCGSKILVNTTARGFQPENSTLDTVSATLSASVQINVSAVSLHFKKHVFLGGIYAQLTGSKRLF